MQPFTTSHKDSLTAAAASILFNEEVEELEEAKAKPIPQDIERYAMSLGLEYSKASTVYHGMMDVLGDKIPSSEISRMIKNALTALSRSAKK
jgi:hypothetical protein